MEFLLTADTVKGIEQECNQTQQEGCFKECLYQRISRYATCVQRGTYHREDVST